MHLYLATELTEGVPDREPTEQIDNCIASKEEIANWIGDGMIRDAKRSSDSMCTSDAR